LSGRHAAVATATAAEQKFAGLPSGRLDVVVDGLPRLLGQLEPDRPTGLLLPHHRAIDRITARCHVLDAQCDHVAAPQLAVDRKIEHRQIARSTIHLQSGVRIDQTCFGRNGGF
jgi:hypothetical protein